ncbi:MAG: nucleotidyltransferase domain-containing protein, partial [Thermoplasmata archaeon]|nr:nucleotidyltransferase domain-containing protein [Thermoplasmata archaeon]
MKEKVVYHQDPKSIVYDSAHWNLLRELRDEGFDISQRLPVPSFIYGSIARGDVHAGSDIDIIMLEPVS